MKIVNQRITAVVAGATILVGLGAAGAVAAGKITSADIKNQTIRKADIGPNAVGASEVKNGSLGIVELSAKARASLKGEKGDQGPAGGIHDINATWTANGNSRVEGYTAVLKGTNTSVETKNLGVAVQAGDIISFEYSLLDGATCGAGGPRMFVTIGGTTENTFDEAACGTNGEVAYVLKNGGTITDAGLVHDNGSGGTAYVTDVMVDGMPVFLG